MSRAAPVLCLSLLFGLGCRSKRASENLPLPAPSSGPSVTSATADAPADASHAIVTDITRDLDACTLGHRGVLLDFGDPSMAANAHPGTLAHGDDEIVEHAGATWLRARSRTLTASFYWSPVTDAADASVYVELRVRGLAARAVAVAIDGKAMGSSSLAKGEARIVVARPSSPVSLAPGGHEVTLHFVGGAHASAHGGDRGNEEALAEVDWVHVGSGDSTEPYAAPTRADVLVDAVVGGRSLRALSLRAPGFARCSGWIPANATLEVSLASSGGGDAEVEARLVRDRRAPVVLGTAHASGTIAWTPWSVPVTGLDGDGALASVELVVRRADKGARVLLGHPRIVAAESSTMITTPPARSALVVVLGSTSAKSLAPWGGVHPAPELSQLASIGTLFLAHRASSSLAHSVLASMLTGLPARAHGVDVPDARLPEGVVTFAEACRQAGITTAMFTANPTTGAAFGFARGWDQFTAHDPLEDAPGTRVFDDAAAWIDAHKADRFVVVVHARGGHPPWDATPEELRAMPPEGYLGVVEPRRAAEALAKARKRPARLKDDDRVRAWALYDHAVDDHDAALGRLLGALRSAGRDGDTAVVVTGDVAASDASGVPLGDADTLDEPVLATPLVVRWPGAVVLAGKRVDAATSAVDVARTIMSALGLEPPATFRGVDLAQLAQGAVLPVERPLLATRGARFSVRWGPYVLLGARDREVRLCDLSLDPACIADIRATSPLALAPLHRWTYDALALGPPPRAPVPIVIDDHLKASLQRWGRLSAERENADDGP